MQVMNAKMQNLKPNLKDNKRTIWIFFFKSSCFHGFTLYLEVGVERENKIQKQKRTIFQWLSRNDCKIVLLFVSFSNLEILKG